MSESSRGRVSLEKKKKFKQDLLNRSKSIFLVLPLLLPSFGYAAFLDHGYSSSIILFYSSSLFHTSPTEAFFQFQPAAIHPQNGGQGEGDRAKNEEKEKSEAGSEAKEAARLPKAEARRGSRDTTTDDSK